MLAKILFPLLAGGCTEMLKAARWLVFLLSSANTGNLNTYIVTLTTVAGGIRVFLTTQCFQAIITGSNYALLRLVTQADSL